MCFCESLVFCGDLGWLWRCCRFLRAQAWFLRLIQTAFAKACVALIAQSVGHVGDVVVRCEDTVCTRVFVVKPLKQDMRVAQILKSGHLLIRSFG